MSRLRRFAKHAIRAVGCQLLTRGPTAAGLRQAMPLEWIGLHLRELLARLDVTCVIDVGANTGQYALMLRDVGYRGRIVSFEPVLANVQELQRHAAGDAQWQVRPVALGKTEGRSTMRVTRWSVFSSLLEANEEAHRFGPGGAFDHYEEVTVSRLDSLWGEIVAGLEAPRVFLKLDTQGYDMEVLAGAPKSLPNVMGLQCELAMVPAYVGESDYLHTLQQLSELGLRVTGLFPVSRDDRLALTSVDCVLRR